MYNICVIRPEGYDHYRAFDEVVELLVFAFTELGISCSKGQNSVCQDRINIIVGCHLIGHVPALDIPPSSIILNTEPIFSAQNRAWTETIVRHAVKYEIWDYNEKNIAALKLLGITKLRLLSIGYQKELMRIPRATDQDVDVLFYGSYNDRRQKVIEALRERGLNVVTLFGVYGAERDQQISRAKVVLNMHFYDTHVFEIVRVFYLMTNAKAVVAEVGGATAVEQRFLPGFKAVPYHELVDACDDLVRNQRDRRSLEQAALSTIMKWTQSTLLRPLLGASGADPWNAK